MLGIAKPAHIVLCVLVVGASACADEFSPMTDSGADGSIIPGGGDSGLDGTAKDVTTVDAADAAPQTWCQQLASQPLFCMDWDEGSLLNGYKNGAVAQWAQNTLTFATATLDGTAKSSPQSLKIDVPSLLPQTDGEATFDFADSTLTTKATVAFDLYMHSIAKTSNPAPPWAHIVFASPGALVIDTTSNGPFHALAIGGGSVTPAVVKENEWSRVRYTVSISGGMVDETVSVNGGQAFKMTTSTAVTAISKVTVGGVAFAAPTSWNIDNLTIEAKL